MSRDNVGSGYTGPVTYARASRGSEALARREAQVWRRGGARRWDRDVRIIIIIMSAYADFPCLHMQTPHIQTS